MDRQIVYPGQVPLETDILNTNKYALIGLGKLAAAIFGHTSMVNGLACTPTNPASMQIQVAPGEIYSLQNIDGTPYSSLAADTNHQIMKQGLMMDALTLNCPAPTTAGFSVNYLVQATYQDVDADNTALPYYNTQNPQQAFFGANNNGLAQPTTRKGVCVVTVKTGIAATTGSQQIPAPDLGFIGLYVITVAYGQTSIGVGNIAAINGAFINSQMKYALLNSPAFTGTPTAPTPAQGDNSQNLATTAFVQTLLAGFSTVPTGLVVYFSKSTAPTGFLKANGAAVSRTTYADLFAVIGTTFGAGDGSTTFNVPDSRGEFIRGWDDGRGTDIGRVFGSWQADAMRQITGSFTTVIRGGVGASGAFATLNSFNDNVAGGVYSGSGHDMTFDNSRVTAVAEENRPRNVALLACIKY